MARMLALVLALGLCAPAVHASPYWIAYEATNDYPEDEGWTRLISHGGAQRSLEDGALVLDSSASGGIFDYYRMIRPGAIDPGPGEAFALECRLKIDMTTSQSEAGFAVFADDGWALGIGMAADRVYSAYEPGLEAALEPDVWHAFRVVSADMRNYALYVDDALTLQGSFYHSTWVSQVSWGDGGQGGTSITRYDYFRFGSVPEPGTASSICLVIATVLRGVCRK